MIDTDLLVLLTSLRAETHEAEWIEFNQSATNASLRKRFSFEDEDYKIVSKIISDTIQEGLIKPYDPDNRSRRHARYVPYWA